MGRREQDHRRNDRDRMRLAQDPSLFIHGNLRTFALGCRCDPCQAEADGLMARQLAGWETVPNRMKPWTGPEREAATARREDGRYLRSTSEVATLLGRSYGAVKTMRKKLLRMAT